MTGIQGKGLMTLPTLPSTRDYQQAPSYADVVWMVRAALTSVVTVMLYSQDRIPPTTYTQVFLA